ncbi:MAG: extensin family protein [Pseudomonadota bacterium]
MPVLAQAPEQSARPEARNALSDGSAPEEGGPRAMPRPPLRRPAALGPAEVRPERRPGGRPPEEVAGALASGEDGSGEGAASVLLAVPTTEAAALEGPETELRRPMVRPLSVAAAAADAEVAPLSRRRPVSRPALVPGSRSSGSRNAATGTTPDSSKLSSGDQSGEAGDPAQDALPAMTVPRPKVRPRRIERRAQRAARAAAQPQGTVEAAPAAAAPAVAAASVAAPAARPSGRPKGLLGGLFQRSAQPAYPARGSVCGVRAIRGAEIAPIRGRVRGCGVAEPVRITEVAGVRLSTPATVDCPTAQALHRWIEEGAKPAVGRTGGGLAALQVAAHYACRTRNNRPGARISEHGRGRAIDISAIVLENGQRITVLHGWRSPQNRTTMRAMHRAACGPFGTVLGPNADRFHQDHFHFDTARYRSGPYCR